MADAAVPIGFLVQGAEKANEILRIEVLERISFTEKGRGCAYVYDLAYRVRVLEVARSITGLDVDDELTVRYTHTTGKDLIKSAKNIAHKPQNQWKAASTANHETALIGSMKVNSVITRPTCVGGSRPGILEEGQQTIAFLTNRDYAGRILETWGKEKSGGFYTVATSDISFNEQWGAAIWQRIKRGDKKRNNEH